MATAAAPGMELLAERRPRTSVAGKLLRLARKNILGTAGALIVLVMVLVAIFAPVLTNQDPTRLSRNRLAEPSAQHRFGTDNLGRDVFSRIIYGSRISLYVGFIAVIVGTTFGTIVGAVGAYFRGAVDFWLQRVMDGMFAFPTVILALTIVSVLGQSLTNVIIAVGITSVPRVSRVVRSSALSIMGQSYVEAARAMGCTDLRMLMRHVLPNCMAPIIILATSGFGAAVLAEASLSFLGLGAPLTEPSWGGMLSGAAQQYVRVAPWLAIIPGLAISLAVFGFNMFGDALRDVLDPKHHD